MQLKPGLKIFEESPIIMDRWYYLAALGFDDGSTKIVRVM